LFPSAFTVVAITPAVVSAFRLLTNAPRGAALSACNASIFAFAALRRSVSNILSSVIFAATAVGAMVCRSVSPADVANNSSPWRQLLRCRRQSLAPNFLRDNLADPFQHRECKWIHAEGPELHHEGFA
jgi:hypothetical protein